MKIKRIKKIRGAGVLQDFDSGKLPCPDLDFREINLIFGWNGTGKTTLSRVLRCYEVGEVCTKLKKYPNLECEIELDNGRTLSESDFAQKHQVRVFNKDFVEENIFQGQDQDGSNVKPLYYLGKEKIELTRERKEREEKRKTLENIEKVYRQENNRRDKYEKDSARTIKNTLLGIKEYQHYHKDSFVQAFYAIKKSALKEKMDIDSLVIPEKDFVKKLKAVKTHDALILWIEDIKSSSTKLDPAFISSIDDTLGKTASLQKTIEKLKNDWDLSDWIQRGITIHRRRNSVECEFCGNKLPSGRIGELEQHFNKEYSELVSSVEEKLRILKTFLIKDPARILDDDTERLAKSLNAVITELIKKLDYKQKHILEGYAFTGNEKAEITNKINSIKSEAENISDRISAIGKDLETSLVAGYYNEYNEKTSQIEESKHAIDSLKNEIKALDETIVSGRGIITPYGQRKITPFSKRELSPCIKNVYCSFRRFRRKENGWSKLICGMRFTAGSSSGRAKSRSLGLWG